jgi:hypothetical protein
LLCAPAVSLWLAEQIGKRTQGVSSIGDHWRNVLGTLKKDLPPDLLLINRQGTAKAFGDWVFGNPGPLAVRAPSPQEMVDVFAAWVHTLPQEEADAVASRTIVVDDAETWKNLATSNDRLILIAGTRLEASLQQTSCHHMLKLRSPRSMLPRVLEASTYSLHRPVT